ncbi:recombination protein RecT [Micromonospora sp. NPDC050695]|uniref:recombination protein RecT n=1 Tax=Micromonospora sp. NPDC050695 TaxID=3154938 RepID=UPI0033E74006
MTTAKQQPNAATALATRRENGGVATNTIADQIRAMQKEYQLAMPRGAEATQLVRDALTALRMTKDLAKCDAPSVLGSLMTCAQLGLRPGVLGHAWLLPFWDRKSGGHKAQLVIGYQGLIELAHRSGKVASLIARTVYEGDEFDVDYGLSDRLVHKPDLFRDGEGKPVAYYAIVKFVGGGHAFYVMSHRQMLAYRDKHATARNRAGEIVGPWVSNFDGMAAKTCVRQLAKWMPKSTELAMALAADEGIRVDLTPTADPAEATTHPEFVEGEVVAAAEPAKPVDPEKDPEAWLASQEPPTGGAA